MSNPLPLPADVQERIFNILLNHKHVDRLKASEEITQYIDTEWKQKLDQAKQLLSKFISRHEAGLLPDMNIYNEIKTFLDGK